MDSTTLDDIILRLLDVRSGRPGKQVQLSEAEIRQLCLASKDIFLAQPNLLELEAPIKICGRFSHSLPAREAFRRKVLSLVFSFLFFPLVRLVFSLNTLEATFVKWSGGP
jgi:hypothetical protein